MRQRMHPRGIPSLLGMRCQVPSGHRDRMMIKTAMLIATLAAGLLVGSRAAEAQPSTGKVWRIGAVMSLHPPDAAPPRAFRKHLHTLRYVEGQNLVIEWRDARGRDDRLPGLAAELVRLNVDRIVADTTLATRAAMQATATIPIVFATSADAVGGGLVSNLAHPGGNVTGNSLILEEMGVIRLHRFTGPC